MFSDDGGRIEPVLHRDSWKVTRGGGGAVGASGAAGGGGLRAAAAGACVLCGVSEVFNGV